MIWGQLRQIVHSTREKYGKLPGFGPFDRGLISVRSVVDLRSACGRSSVVSSRWRGFRLESTQAHFQRLLARLDLLVRAGFFVGPHSTNAVRSYWRFGVENPGSASPEVLELTFSENGKRP